MNKISSKKYLLLIIIILLNLVFIMNTAFPYVIWKPHKMKYFSGREIWIFIHVVFGVVALLAGPIQYFLAWSSHFSIHKILGRLYVVAVALSGAASFYLAIENEISTTYGLGLFILGLSWWVTSFLSLRAILNNKKQSHAEWIFRSYAVTMGFVFFRIFVSITTALEIGTHNSRFEFASWFCWLLPLAIAEIFIKKKRENRDLDRVELAIK